MFEKLELTRMAQALAAHSGARLSLVAQNLAHADTPGYRARDLPDFATVWRGMAADGATRGATRPMVTADPADPNGNSVGIEAQMIRAADIRQAHDMALAVQRATSAVVRAALGRGGA